MTTEPKRKAPAPKATAPIASGDHGLQDRMAEIEKRREAEYEEAFTAQNDAFMALFAKWLKGRADRFASTRPDRCAMPWMRECWDAARAIEAASDRINFLEK